MIELEAQALANNANDIVELTGKLASLQDSNADTHAEFGVDIDGDELKKIVVLIETMIDTRISNIKSLIEDKA